MSLKIVDIPDIPQRPGSDFDRAIKERLTQAHPVKIPSFTVQELKTLTPRLYDGYIVRCSNGNAGDQCLAYCDGFKWKVIELGLGISLT